MQKISSMRTSKKNIFQGQLIMASGVVATLCSKTISPASSKTQYALKRSPRSSPMEAGIR
jgi:hypothetical protein